MLEGPSQLCMLRSCELSILHSQAVCKPRRLAEMKKDGEEAEAAGVGARVRPIRAVRRARLAILIQEFGGPKALAERTKTVDTHLIAIQGERRDIGDALAQKLEEGTGKPFGWMDLPLGFSPEAFKIASQLDKITDPDAKHRAFLICDTATLSFADKAASQPSGGSPDVDEGGDPSPPTPRPAPAQKTHTAPARAAPARRSAPAETASPSGRRGKR